MGLKGIDVFGHKVTSRSMTIPVDGVISRAFELMEKTLPRIANSLKIGGRVFFMKGPAVADELKTFHQMPICKGAFNRECKHDCIYYETIQKV